MRQAAILDPRFKINVFADGELATRATAYLQTEAQAVQKVEMDETPSTSQTQVEDDDEDL